MNGYPDIGLVLYDKRPDYASEIEWFHNLYSQIFRKNAIAVVAEEDGRVVGMCDIHRLRPNSEVSHIGNLGIAIGKEYRGRAIGTKLMLKALEDSKNMFEMIQLQVFAINKAAISLYRKIGFAEYGRCPGKVKRNGGYYGVTMMYYRY